MSFSSRPLIRNGDYFSFSNIFSHFFLFYLFLHNIRNSLRSIQLTKQKDQSSNPWKLFVTISHGLTGYLKCVPYSNKVRYNYCERTSWLIWVKLDCNIATNSISEYFLTDLKMLLCQHYERIRLICQRIMSLMRFLFFVRAMDV